MKRPQISPEDRRARVYRERNRNIRAMGFKDYADYLKPLREGGDNSDSNLEPACLKCNNERERLSD